MSERGERPTRAELRRRRYEGHALVTAHDRHSDPSHHIGPCSPDCRRGRVAHVHRAGRHLYRGPTARFAKAEFTRRYGPKKGAYVYGATIHKVKMEQLAAARLARRARVSPRNARRMMRRSR